MRPGGPGGVPPGAPVVLASTDDLRPRRRTYLVFLSVVALIGLAVPIKLLAGGARLGSVLNDAWIALVLGLVALLGAVSQVAYRREVRVDRAGGLILACDSLSFSTVWERIPLADFDRVQVSDQAAQLAGPRREPVALTPKTDNRIAVLRAGVRAAAKSGLALELMRIHGAPGTIAPEQVRRYAAEFDSEDLPWWRQGAALGLVAANLVPLAGVLFLGWGVLGAMLVFWMDNVAYMLFGFARMLLARNYDGREAHAGDKIAALLFVGFVCTVFTAFHALFLIMIFGPGAMKAAGLQIHPLPWGWLQVVPVAGMLVSAFAIVASRGYEFYDKYLAPRAYEEAEMGKEVPILRMIMMHMGIIIGAAAIGLTGSPAAMLGVLVLLKSWADLAVYMDRYRSRATPALKSLLTWQ